MGTLAIYISFLNKAKLIKYITSPHRFADNYKILINIIIETSIHVDHLKVFKQALNMNNKYYDRKNLNILFKKSSILSSTQNTSPLQYLANKLDIKIQELLKAYNLPLNSSIRRCQEKINSTNMQSNQNKILFYLYDFYFVRNLNVPLDKNAYATLQKQRRLELAIKYAPKKTIQAIKSNYQSDNNTQPLDSMDNIFNKTDKNILKLIYSYCKETEYPIKFYENYSHNIIARSLNNKPAGRYATQRADRFLSNQNLIEYHKLHPRN